MFLISSREAQPRCCLSVLEPNENSDHFGLRRVGCSTTATYWPFKIIFYFILNELNSQKAGQGNKML